MVFLCVLQMLAQPVPPTSPASAGGPVCVVVEHPEAAALLAADELPAAWTLEQRKAGLDVPLVEVVQRSGCPADAALVIELAPDAAHYAAPDGTEFDQPLGELEEWERARAVARAAVETLRARDDGPTPFSAPAPPALEVPTEPSGAAGVRWGATAGAVYGLHPGEGPHRGGVEFGAHAALLDEQLVLELRGSWAPSQRIDSAPAAVDWTAVTVGPHARWGFAVEPLWLRLGVGVEAEWREVATRLPTRLDTVALGQWTAALVAEMEAELAVGRHARLALALSARVTPTGRGYLWEGARIYEAPVVAGAAALRVGFWAP